MEGIRQLVAFFEYLLLASLRAVDDRLRLRADGRALARVEPAAGLPGAGDLRAVSGASAFGRRSAYGLPVDNGCKSTGFVWQAGKARVTPRLAAGRYGV